MNEKEREVNLGDQVKVRREKLAALQQEGKDPFRITVCEQDAHAQDINGRFEEMEGREVHIAGRIMSKRVMGKASFIDLLDRSGRIQSYVQRELVGEEEYAAFKKFDLGDLVGVRGEVFRTQKGQISVKAHEIHLLAKSLLPLPEKFHGLKDTDLRYRQRYVDLIVNPEVRDVFVKRSQIIREIRRYLDEKAFIEVETPMLQTIAGGAAARPFITHHNALDLDMYLRISLELYLKRLIVGGMERVYELGRVFRNEGMDVRHNPEFTLLELYQAYTDFHGMMALTEDMVRQVARRVTGSGKVTYQGVEIDFDQPFASMTMVEAVKQYAGVDFRQVSTLEEARALAREHQIEFEQRHGKGDILNLFFETYVEEKLVQPTFITEHPLEISPLAKKKPDDPEYVERFELFVYGRELANAFSELNDPIDQRERFVRQVELKNQGDDEANDMDEDFLNALEYGMPPTGGMGMGIDRLVMFLTDSSSIRDVLLFPTMKPLDK